MKTLLNRIFNILIHPKDEWLAIKDEPPTHRNIFKYAAILAAVPPVAAIAGRMLFDRNIPDSALSSSISSLMLTNMIWYGMYVVNVVVTGMIIAAILTLADSRWNGLIGFTIAAYAFTPLSLAGCFAVVPYLGWTIYPAILYGIYLIYLGITLLADIPKQKAIWFALSSFSAAAVVVAVMNFFEYLFESFLVGKVFS
jgi:hypothetical protein